MNENIAENYDEIINEISQKTEDSKNCEDIIKYLGRKMNSKKWQRILKVKLVKILRL